jgi:outer membrane protein OmpA-like peptidoglycan-associated protein
MTRRATLSKAVILGAVALGTVSLGGCATKKFVREQVGVVDTKLQGTQEQVTAQQGALQTHETRLADLDRTTREALERAEAAGKLAEGKFLYQMVLSDDSVKFPVDRYALSPEAETRLAEFAQKLKSDNKNVYLEIQGHTDASGPQTYNQRLGEERAEAVRLFLNKQGVALNRMATISYGEEAPVAPNNTRQGRAQNRRVAVVVLS